MKTGIRYEIVPYDGTSGAATPRPAPSRLPLEDASPVRTARHPGNATGRRQRIVPSYGPGGTADPLADAGTRGVLVDLYA